MIDVAILIQDSVSSPSDLRTLLYFTLAALITLGIETLRRWIKHRMDIWEANHPVPKREGKDDRSKAD